MTCKSPRRGFLFGRMGAPLFSHMQSRDNGSLVSKEPLGLGDVNVYMHLGVPWPATDLFFDKIFSPLLLDPDINPFFCFFLEYYFQPFPQSSLKLSLASPVKHPAKRETDPGTRIWHLLSLAVHIDAPK